MLNFDAERYLRIQGGAVSTAPALEAAVAAMGEIRNVFWLGAGGAGYLMGPAASLLARASTLPSFQFVGAELVAQGSPHLGQGSLVVVPSLSGTTPDALEHIRFVKEAGATVLALVGNGDSPVAAAADHVVVNAAADDTSSESFYLQSQLLALALMRARGECDEYDELVTALAGMPQALLAAKERIEPRAEELARHIASHDYHLFSGAAETWSETAYYAMCILEEMQWIRTRPVQASDFFHGALELVEPGVSVILLKGTGPGRAQVERVERFAAEKTDALVVLDAAEFDLPQVPPRFEGIGSPVVLAAVLERVSAHLEVLRDHPLTVRRYYRRETY